METPNIPPNQAVYEELYSNISEILKLLANDNDTDYVHFTNEEQKSYGEFLHHYIGELQCCLNTIENPQVQIAFCGYTSSGKTSLINKLLGSETFRELDAEESGVSCYISKGDEDKFVLHEYSETDDGLIATEVNLEEFKKKTSMTIGEDFYESIDCSEVTLNNPHIPDNIKWIDTAGLTSKGKKNKLERLEAVIENADAIVWVSGNGGSGGFLNQGEVTYLQSLFNNGYKHPIFLVNNIFIAPKNWATWSKKSNKELDKLVQDLNMGERSPEEAPIYTIIDKEWHQLFTADILKNKKASVANAFQDYTPIIIPVSELDKLYQDPHSVRSMYIMQFLHSSKAAMVELHSFSTYYEVKRIENDLHFEHFRNKISQLNHPNHNWVFNSRVAKVQRYIRDFKQAIQSFIVQWDNTIKAKEQLMNEMEKKSIVQINEAITKRLDNMINIMENGKKSALNKFQSEHQKLLETTEKKLLELDSDATSVDTWNSFVAETIDQYLYFDNGLRKNNYSYNDRHITKIKFANGKLQDTTNTKCEIEGKSGKGGVMTRQMESEFYESYIEGGQLNPDIKLILFNNYFSHLNYDFLMKYRLKISDFGDSYMWNPFSNYNGDDFPYKQIFMGYIESTNNNAVAGNLIRFFVQSKNEFKNYNLLNIRSSIEHTKKIICESYDERISYLQKIKKKKIESDKIEFLNTFRDEYLSEYYEVANTLKSCDEQASTLLFRLQLHSILRP